MKEEYRIETSADPQSVMTFLEDRIFEFNSSKLSKHDGVYFAKTVQDENGNLAAGIAG